MQSRTQNSDAAHSPRQIPILYSLLFYISRMNRAVADPFSVVATTRR